MGHGTLGHFFGSVSASKELRKINIQHIVIFYTFAIACAIANRECQHVKILYKPKKHRRTKMNISSDELFSISERMSEKDKLLTRYEMEMQKLRVERDVLASDNALLKERVGILENMLAAAELKSIILKNYIILSAEKIKAFVATLSSIDRWAFLHTFMTWTIPDEHRAEELQRIDEVMELPQTKAAVVMNTPTFNGPMYDVHGNDEVKLND